MDAEAPLISVVAPVYGNAETLAELSARVAAVCRDRRWDYELIFVDDGSRDRSAAVIDELATRDASVGGVLLLANVGQQRAVMTGLRHCRGEWSVVLDADLQDPPEAIPALWERAQEGFDAVFAGRVGRYQAWHRMITSRAYKLAQHWVCNVPTDAGMFVLMRRRLVRELLTMGLREELSLVVRIGLAGRRCTSLPVRRDLRPSGRSAYTSRDRWHVGFHNLLGALRWRSRAEVRQTAAGSPVSVARRVGVCAGGPATTPA